MSTKRDSITIPINQELEKYSIDWKGAFLDILLSQSPIVISYRELSERWGFKLGKTQNILKRFQEDKLINIETIDFHLNITLFKEEKEIKVKQENKSKIINIPFTDFWELYNKKEGFAKCNDKWETLKDIDREQIMLHVPTYIAKITDKKFQKHPLTYLNQQCWLDMTVTNKIEKEDNKTTIINNKKYER